MNDFYDVLKLIDATFEINECENVDINNALGRIVCKNIVSKYDFPPFDKSTMDGFALNFDNINNINPLIFSVRDTVYAGEYKDIRLKNGECVRIMTGARVPNGCDTVIEFEKTKTEGDEIKISGELKPYANIAKKAEDLKRGDIVFKKGMLIKPNMINLFASLGMDRIPVNKKLKIGVITTGDELVELDETLSFGKIHDSSRYSLISQIKAIGQDYVNFGIVKDDETEITNALRLSLDKCDIVLITGGSSFGDKDFTHNALDRISARVLIKEVAMKPGKPTILAQYKDKWIFGMPGNPVSTYSVFKLFVSRLISKLLRSNDLITRLYKGKIDFNFKKKPDRIHFIPSLIEFVDNEFVIKRLSYHGSGDFTALAYADAFFVAPKDISLINKGDYVKFFFV